MEHRPTRILVGLATRRVCTRTNANHIFRYRCNDRPPTPWLDDAHTIFGEIVGEEDQVVVDSIDQGDTIESISVEEDIAPILAAVGDRLDEWNSKLS